VTAGDWLTYDDFAGRESERFEVTGGGSPPQPLELAEATQSTVPGGVGPDGRQRLQFSLVFRGQAGLAQGTYRLEHAELGELDLFLVPIGPEDGSMRYEAAFA
jgi:uncharacterized protein DUF6916